MISNQDLACEKQEQNVIALEFMGKDNTNCCSTYTYTPQQIEEHFASDNGQAEEHSLEDSICRPLIGKYP